MPLVQYLFTLYDATGVPAHKCPCKTYTLGFGLAVKAVFHIVSEFFSKTKFKYFLTYFHSQDPLEITFSKVRRRGGHNNNPNVQQFKGAMKRLLLKNSIVASAAANCTTLADGKSYGGILEIKWRPKKKDSIVLRKGVDLEGEEEEQVLDLEQLNQLKMLQGGRYETIRKNILYYISGYLVRNLLPKIQCFTCMTNLLHGENDPVSPYDDHCYTTGNKYTDNPESLFKTKDCGGLVRPSAAVYKIVLQTETELRMRTNDFDSAKLNGMNPNNVLHHVVQGNPIHFCDEHLCPTDDDMWHHPHRYELLLTIIKNYMNLRLLTLPRMLQDQNAPVSTRHLLNTMTKIVCNE